MSWSVSGEQFAAYGEPLRARPLGSLAATSIGGAAILVLLAALILFRPSAATEPALVSRPYVELPAAVEPAPAVPAQKAAAFDLDAPEFGKDKKVSVEPAPQGGGRLETLSFGAFEANGLYLRLDILQPLGQKNGNSDFFLDMARHASQAGLAVSRIGQPVLLAARLGPFEAADIRLSLRGADGAAIERGCTAVRHIDSKLSIEIAGLACGVAAKPLDRRVIGCLVDRLYYRPGGADQAMERAFAKTEGQSCLTAASEPAPAAVHPVAKKRAAHH
jgi:hypothetical protein